MRSVISHTNAFTLVEILVVISILAIIAAIVLTNLRSARESARMNGALQFESSLKNSLGHELVGSWTFDQSTDDSSGNGFHGQLVGTGVQRDSGATGECLRGGCLFLDGTAGSFMRLVNSNNPSNLLKPQAVTVSMWFKPDADAVTKDQMLLAVGSAGYRIRYRGDAGYITMGANDGASMLFPLVNRTLAAGKWQHLVFVFNGDGQVDGYDQAALYLDGVLRETQTSTSFDPVSYDSNFINVGYFAGGQTDGWIDEVRIYADGFDVPEGVQD